MFLELDDTLNSLTDLVIEFDKAHVLITKQAINKRYSQEACDFFQQVLEELINISVNESTVILKSIPFVKNSNEFSLVIK